MESSQRQAAETTLAAQSLATIAADLKPADDASRLANAMMQWRLLFSRVWLAPLLIAMACAAAAAVAYGNDPNLMHHDHGLAILFLVRRLMWPLLTASILLCIALIGLVIANKRSAWWLIGLLPVVALLSIRLTQKPHWIRDNPNFVTADIPSHPLSDDDRVVGVTLNEQTFALPFESLFASPVVFLSERDKRAILIFSEGGNRALAFGIARELKAKDLEILAMLDGVPILYNSRLGQFIVGETGKTVEHRQPIGFLNPLPTEKTTWSAWHADHPDSKQLYGDALGVAPASPALAGSRVLLIATTRPTVLPADAIKDAPLNLKTHDQSLLLLRNPGGKPRAFDRQVGADLFPKFSLKINRKLPEAALLDDDTASAWTIDGKAIAGPLKGQKLKELSIESDLDWPTLKFWEPDMKLTNTDGH